MDERKFSRYGSEPRYGRYTARPDLYINRISATVLALIKLLDGAAAGFSLYGIFRMLFPVIDALTKNSMNLDQALQLILSEFGISPSAVDSFTGPVFEAVSFPVIIWGLILLLTIMSLLLVVIEAAALLMLRIVKKGAGTIRAIHLIYMAGSIVSLVLFAYSVFDVVRLYLSRVRAVGQPQDVFLSMGVPLIIVGGICLIILLLNLCYHKDIAMAMRTVAYETQTGKPGRLKKTHLSGISFLFGLPWLLFLFLILAALGPRSRELAASLGRELTVTEKITAIAMPLIMFIKHLSICLCNRNLKRVKS